MAAPQQPTLFDLSLDPWLEDNARDVLVARVVFSQGADGVFDYRVPDPLRVSMAAGKRVRVPLGRSNRGVVGYCVEVTNARRHVGMLKDVQSVLDLQPIASESMLQLTRWMSEYYLVSWGRVLECVVPAGVRKQAGTRHVNLLAVAPSVILNLETLRLPAKQMDVLRTSMRIGPLTLSQLCHAAGCTSAPLQSLRRKGLLVSTTQRVQAEWDTDRGESQDVPHDLNPSQQLALEAIEADFTAKSGQVYLLHGVTGSGKTEVYMRAIQLVVSAGRQAIVLVPEISLTPQTCRRFRARFQRVAVLHSHLSDAERHWHWQQIASGAVQVVVGARSAVFAPTPHLGLIVIDEEHDASFKQDNVPRYHARSVALHRARMERIPVILGSATPSLESWHHAQTGAYRLVSMGIRICDLPMPPVEVVDLRTRTFDRNQYGAISRPLEQEMRQAFDGHGQVILLLNRRGFSTHIQCPACGDVVYCPECDIALTHHRDMERAVCHYCDHQRPAPTHCPKCRFTGIKYSGLGTQRLEAEVRARVSEPSRVADGLRFDEATR